MPTYEYQCKTCGHQFEQAQRFSDPPLTECPKCSGAVRRMIFPAGVIFKGSGWYITDSRKSSADAKEGKAEQGAKAEAASSSGGGGKAAEKAASGSGE